HDDLAHVLLRVERLHHEAQAQAGAQNAAAQVAGVVLHRPPVRRVVHHPGLAVDLQGRDVRPARGSPVVEPVHPVALVVARPVPRGLDPGSAQRPARVLARGRAPPVYLRRVEAVLVGHACIPLPPLGHGGTAQIGPCSRLNLRKPSPYLRAAGGCRTGHMHASWTRCVWFVSSTSICASTLSARGRTWFCGPAWYSRTGTPK